MVATVRNVKKSLAVMEDLLQGVGSDTQSRAGIPTAVNKIDIPFAVNTTLEMQDLDINIYTRARIYINTRSYIDYIYDPNATEGDYQSNTGSGYWVQSNITAGSSGRLSAIYDFAVYGGNNVTINLGSKLPNNAVITNAYYEVINAFASAGAAIIALGIRVDDVSGLKAFTAYNDSSFNAGFHQCIPDGTVANFTNKTTAEQSIIITIGTAPVTSGKLRIWADYILSE